ncbi:hypothetical protein FRB95_000786 [Tulasnella sp. JGI-2019a]|nr:hypothetical protein FRB95_000786 [Tulasnella sp. JGI-2019a]
MSKKKPANSVYEHLASGGLSGFAAALALQPLDLLKTRVQQADGAANGSRRSATAITKQIYAQHGVLGLWRGTIPTLARNVPGVAIYFYTLQALRQRLTQVSAFGVVTIDKSSPSALPKLSPQGNLVSGVVARLGVGLLLNPFSVMKARFESDRYAYKSMLEAFTSILRESGPRGLVQGFNASALRDAPFAGLYVLFYEAIKDKTSLLLGPNVPITQAAIYTWSGATAGAMATVATHPFDVMKTRMQVNSDIPQYRSLPRTVVAIFKQRGIMGFFDGASIRVSRKIFSSAISWTVYETLLVFWRDRQKLV